MRAVPAIIVLYLIGFGLHHGQLGGQQVALRIELIEIG